MIFLAAVVEDDGDDRDDGTAASQYPIAAVGIVVVTDDALMSVVNGPWFTFTQIVSFFGLCLDIIDHFLLEFLFISPKAIWYDAV